MKILWEQKVLPAEWNEAILYPIHKKRDKANCRNYRNVALLNVVYKILATHIKNTVTAQTDGIIGEYQSEFRKSQSTIEQIYFLREI